MYGGVDRGRTYIGLGYIDLLTSVRPRCSVFAFRVTPCLKDGLA